MKHLTRRLIPLVLALVLALSALPVQAANDSDNISIGLLYGSTATAAANLENSTGYGAGYRFGYFDSELKFIELGQTGESITKLTVLRASDIYRSGSSYSTKDNGGEAIGCYHLQLPESYSDFDAARATADGYSGGFVSYINGTYYVRIGAYLTKGIALTKQAEAGFDTTIAGTSSYAMNAVQTGTSQIIFQYDSSSSPAFGVYPDVTGVDEIATWCKGYRYAGAFRYERVTGGDLTVSSVVDIETYVKGVIPYEMTNSWPLEALKAQAVCARSYGYLRLSESKHSNSYHFDLCNTDCCQVYHGVGSGSSIYQANEATDRAVEETAGVYLFYNNQVADTFFSSSHGGASESIQNAWGTSLSKYPYLCGVIDPYESLVADLNPYSSWKKTYTKSELTSILQAYGYAGGTSVEGVETVFSKTGNVIDLIFHYTNGKTQTFGPTSKVRSSYLGLRSLHFNINGELPIEEDTGASSVTVTINGEAISADTLYGVTNRNTTSKLNLSNDIYVLSGDSELEAVDLSALDTSVNPNVDVDYSGSVYTDANTLVFYGAGWGHQLGMSQWGAYAMASECNMTYDEILTFYYPGTHVDTQ